MGGEIFEEIFSIQRPCSLVYWTELVSNILGSAMAQLIEINPLDMCPGAERLWQCIQRDLWFFPFSKAFDAFIISASKESWMVAICEMLQVPLWVDLGTKDEEGGCLQVWVLFDTMEEVIHPEWLLDMGGAPWIWYPEMPILNEAKQQCLPIFHGCMEKDWKSNSRLDLLNV